MTEWDKFLKRRTDGLGFMSRLGAWREPTPAEIAAALAIETKSWQETKGKKSFTATTEYTTALYKSPVDYGTNLKTTRADGEKAEHRQEAIKAYVETPINVGKQLWVEMDWWTAVKHWLKGNKIKIGSFLRRIK